MKWLLPTVVLSMFQMTTISFGADTSSTGSHPTEKADWTTLALDDGRIVEMAVDFKIERMEIGSDGEAKMILKGKIDKEEVGFSAKISKPTLGTILVKGSDETPPVSRSTLTIVSLGEPTKVLERLIRQQPIEQRTPKRNRFVGIYVATFEVPTTTFEFPSIFHASSDGITFDDNGTQVREPAEHFYDLDFFLDGPRMRLTVYFTECAAYGSSSSATFARRQWLQSITSPKK